MVKTIVIPRHSETAPYIQELAGIDEFQDITGGWIEPFSIEPLGVTIWTNEAASRKHGGFNTRATALYWYYGGSSLSRRSILGDVVLTCAVDQLATSDISPQVAEMLIDPHHFVVQVSPKDDGAWCDTHACFENIFDALLWCMLFVHRLAGRVRFRIKTETSVSHHCDHSAPETSRLW